MDENEITILTHSKMNVVRMGKAMDVFSIFVLLFSVLFALGGLFLIYYSSTLPMDMPHYIDNILTIMGFGSIAIAAAFIPIVVRMRQAVHIARQLKVNSDISPIRAFLRVCRDLWRYSTILLMALFVLAVLFVLMLYIYLVPTLSTI